MSTLRRHYPGRRSLLALAALALAGCGPAAGEVSGKILFKGEPLPFGDVTFHIQDGPAKSAAIGPEGMYVIRGCPAGPVKITVRSLPRVPEGLAQARGPRRTHPGRLEQPVHIPDRYHDPERSELTYTVEAGQHTFDIVLAP
jgi:hypothetical protein